VSSARASNRGGLVQPRMLTCAATSRTSERRLPIIRLMGLALGSVACCLESRTQMEGSSAPHVHARARRRARGVESARSILPGQGRGPHARGRQRCNTHRPCDLDTDEDARGCVPSDASPQRAGLQRHSSESRPLLITTLGLAMKRACVPCEPVQSPWARRSKCDAFVTQRGEGSCASIAFSR
jgi:hypothetical protein